MLPYWWGATWTQTLNEPDTLTFSYPTDADLAEYLKRPNTLTLFDNYGEPLQKFDIVDILPHVTRGNNGTVVTVNARSLLERNRIALKLVESSPEDRPLAIQLFGSVPEEMRDAADGVRVNVIAPGFVITDATKNRPIEWQQSFLKARAISREQRPDDLVGTALYLMSDLAAFVTGQTVVVDGGHIMY
jgi:hypothetical protein